MKLDPSKPNFLVVTVLGIVLLAIGLLGIQMPAVAINLAKQDPVVHHVDLGTEDNQLIFDPAQLVFENGKLHKLVLYNPAKVKHYFTAKDFTDAIWTRKIEFSGVEVKGHIREIELMPESSLEWFFVPLKAGNYPLVCTMPGHAEAGMIGEIIITD